MQDDAANKEIAALRGVIRCIEEYKLESEYSPEELKERIEWLRKQKNERKEKEKNAKQKAPGPKAQAQQVSGKKRAFPDSKFQMKTPQNRNKNLRTAQVAVAPNLSSRAIGTVQTVHHHPVGLYEGERTEYLMPPVRMAAASAAASPIVPATRAAAVHAVHHVRVGLLEGEGAEYLLTSAAAAAAPASGPSTSFGAASSFYSTEASHYPADLYTGRGTQYSSGYHNLARSPLDTRPSLQPGTHGLVASPTQRMSQAHEAYNLVGSILDPHHISSTLYAFASSSHLTHLNSSAEQYGTSERSGQFGSPEASQHISIPSNASPRSFLASHPKAPLRVATHGDRPLSSSSGYGNEALSKRPYVFYL